MNVCLLRKDRHGQVNRKTDKDRQKTDPEQRQTGKQADRWTRQAGRDTYADTESRKTATVHVKKHRRVKRLVKRKTGIATERENRETNLIICID